MPTITVSHSFEAAHRLPQLGGKCVNLHGHSWWLDLSVTGDVDERGVVLDFGDVKSNLRRWIDDRLDHGAMLGAADPMLGPLREAECKVFEFGTDEHSVDLLWPTVENVAVLLWRIAESIVEGTAAEVSCVRVRETRVNSVEIRG